MPDRAIVLSVLASLVFSSPVRAEGPIIDHAPRACIAAERFPLLEARFGDPDTISRARVQFRGQGSAWYFVEMKRSGGVFIGVLPKPKKSLKKLSYYIEATDREFRGNRTQEFTADVLPPPAVCVDPKLMAGVATTASVVVGSPAGAAAVPAGFSSAGVASASTAAAAATTGAAAGGGLGTTAVIGVVAAGAAVAGGVAVAAGGNETTTTTVTPSSTGPSPSPLPTAAPAPPPPPSPSPSTGGLSGDWSGRRTMTRLGVNGSRQPRHSDVSPAY
jgi:hypothetical protein